MSSYPSIQVFSLEIEETTTSAKVITIIQMIYGIPSFLLLIAFLIFLGVSKNYKNSFYRLVQLDLLTNIFCYLNNWLSLRFEKIQTGVQIQKSIESVIPGLLDWSNAFTSFFQHMQFCSAIVLSLHRITSVKFVFKSEKFWLRFYPLYYLICVVYSTILMQFSGKTYFISVINGTLTASRHVELTIRAFSLTALYSIIYFFLLLIIGLYAAYSISKKIRTMNTDDRGVSKKLTKIALTYSTIYAGILLWSVLVFLNTVIPWQPAIISDNTFIIWLFSFDMMIIALPYILLIFDMNVRRDVMQLFKRRSSGEASLVFVSANSAVQS